MKKVLCIFRDGYDAEYICRQLEQVCDKYRFCYIIESGKTAKKAKVKRMLKKTNIFAFFVNVFFLLLYDFDMTKRMKKILGNQQYPDNIALQRIQDVNEERCVGLCSDLKPDIVFIYGTGILKKSTMESIQADIYNIHSSILPYYRNVHSDFWAYKNKDFSKIGVTIFKLNAGIDTGDIVLQKQASVPEEAALEDYKVQNLRNIPQMMQEFLQIFFDGQTEYIRQEYTAGSVATTPAAADIMDFWKKRKSAK